MGHKIKKNNTTVIKNIIVTVILILLMFVTGCGKTETGSDVWQTNYTLGKQYLSTGNYQEAIDAFSDAINEDDDIAEAYISRADAFVALGNLEEAIDDYETAIDLDEQAVDAYKGIAKVYVLQGDNKGAMLTLNSAEEAVGKNNQNALYDGIDVLVYSPNATLSINICDMNTYLDSGYYDEPVFRVYNVGGDDMIITEGEMTAKLANSWYERPVVEWYSVDGQTKVVTKGTPIEDGWYEIPVSLIHNKAGESKVVPIDELSQYEAEGWIIEPVVIMYAEDGRTLVVKESEVEIYLNLNWYLEPFVTLYAPDGRTRPTIESEVEAYLNVGWYADPVCYMYAADGRVRVTLVNEIELYERVNWYREPVVIMYAPDGRTRYTLQSEVDAYIKVNWSLTPPYWSGNTTTTQQNSSDNSITLSGKLTGSNPTDQQLIDYATANGTKLYNFRYSLANGSYFKVKSGSAINLTFDDSSYTTWYEVDDSRASSVDDVLKLYHKYFSSSSDSRDVLSRYRDYNGKLYTSNGNYNQRSYYTDFKFTKVYYRNSSSATLAGTVAGLPAYFAFAYENNEWKCYSVYFKAK